MTIRFEAGDAREVLRAMIDRGEHVHAVICDPPYHLESIVKRFGKEGSAAAKHGSDGRFARASKGFMGKEWDGAENGVRIAFDPEFWRLCWDLLPPGGFLAAFASPRNYHRMAVAIEDAGFIIHPLHGWIYGQGAPKGHAIRDDAFEGHFYGTQTTKPALEPICIAQKPMLPGLTGTDNMRLFGVGALNIEACRVEAEEGAKGRWPANVAHDGSDAVLAAFAAAGERKSGAMRPESTRKVANRIYAPDFAKPGASITKHDVEPSSGSAARFFNDLGDDAPFHYCPKATRAEREGSTHPTVKPQKLLQWLARLLCPPGGTILDPFAGSGSMGKAAEDSGMNAILVERDPEYVPFIRQRFGLPLELDADCEALI